MRKVLFENDGFEHLKYWAKTDIKMLKRIFDLLDDIRSSPFNGIGKPEPLKHNFKGFWSRRINDEHRLIYTIKNDAIIVVSCRYHY